MEIAIGHHVYSSLGGYKTLYATPGAPAESIANAEDIARRLYRIVGSRPQRAFYHVSAGIYGAVRGFPFGTDHAGRARTCVHTVLFTGDDLAKVPWFNPFTIPDDLFLPADLEDIQYVRFNLKETWVIPDEPFDPALHGNRFGPSIPEPVLRMLVSAMLDPRATIVLNRRENAFELAQVLVTALPAGLRRRMTYLDRAILQPTSPPVFRLNFFANDPDPSILAGDEILIDFNRGESHNDAVRTAYADFVLSCLAPGGNPSNAWRLACLLERYEPDLAFESSLQVRTLLETYRKGTLLFRPDGTFDVSQGPADANEAVAALLPAGCRRLAYAMLRDVGALVEAKYPDKAAKIRRRVDAVCLRINQQSDPIRDVQKLVMEFRPAFGGGPMRRDEDDTFVSPPAGAVDSKEGITGFED